MTSVLNVDEIAAKNGTDPVALTKQTAAKCFLNFDQSTNTVEKSLNVSSVTDNGVSDITNNFASSFADDDYAPCGFGGLDNLSQNIWIGGPQTGGIGSWKTTGLMQAQASYGNVSRNSDVHDFNLIHFGDLA
jgi:hypothetical protein